ncbi:hypothetical protein ACIA8G_21200 [Lentzea sp. NPDC051213]|uniref:hypothetical protein n=1 Tax=Lentzea sp. NPDC051213 TaxID=3364126 RepID=UPI0037950A4B
MSEQQVLERQPDDLGAALSFHLPPCRVKILMVTDGGGSFGRADFGLSALLDALAQPPGPWVRFDVTTKHRGAGGSPPAFRFDSVDLSQYDQIWMIAVLRSGEELSESELRAIAQFMDGGGGVFATGDHEDLGVKMCGRVPRVRSMRKWHWPSPGPNGEPVAPKVDGPDRRDTLSPGRDAGIQFDDQSDDVPQRICPKLYRSWPWNRYWHRSHPHPLLCGPRGVITVLPDHPHEGECYVPADLSATFTFDGYQTTEYPGGIAPEVIATSAQCGHVDDVHKGVVDSAFFGAIGAYDGFRAGVGRVVVDATWHHFFDINLIGVLGSADPVKGKGFLASDAGKAAFEDIKSYFRNIAVWLARPASQRCMWWRAVWWVRWHHQIAMDLRPHYLGGPEHLDIGELLRVGGEARDALGRVASQCTVRGWGLDHLVRPALPRISPDLWPVLDPWFPRQPRPVPPLPPPPPQFLSGMHGELLLDTTLGAAVLALATAFPHLDEETSKRAAEADLAELAGPHLRQAGRLFQRFAATQQEELAGFGGALDERRREE